MMNSEYAVNLYRHNINSYQTIKETFTSGEKVVGIVHATGTGKSYNALQLAYDNKDKKILYVVPSSGIIEHIKNLIEENPNLNLNRDFPNLSFRTYQSFVNLSADEIASIACDLLILDEFHHIGAPIWGARIQTLLDTHQDLQIFGMTAYTVRDRGTIYERDMANPDTDELFSKKIVSRYDLCDAIIDGVLPKPIYKSACTNLYDIVNVLEQKMEGLKSLSEYPEYIKLLNDVKKRIHEAPSIPSVLSKNIKPNGKYIYFCPPVSEAGTNDIETIKKQAYEWFKGFVKEEDIVFYTSTSDMGKEGELNRDAFYNDISLTGEKVDNKLRIMFAINQYNEGIHAPNIDGVIMGRGTTSDIVYFEQLGRALAVRGNTKEMITKLEAYSYTDLVDMCHRRDIKVTDDLTKEELIEKLIAPVVIDLTNNFSFIKELEDRLKERVREVQRRGIGTRDIKISNAYFDIEVLDIDLYEELKYLNDKLTRTWEDWYRYAKKYYEHHHNLEIPHTFKTNDGYTYAENGVISLGTWISYQRRITPPDSPKGLLLGQIGMRFTRKTLPWGASYAYAKKYYEHHHNLDIPSKFRTNDGYTYDEKGSVNLGYWVYEQREHYKNDNMPEQHIEALQQIGMRFGRKRPSWDFMYSYAKKYYEHHHDLEVPARFKTNDGYTYDENGEIGLGTWIYNQRKMNISDTEHGKLLAQIGMRFNRKMTSLSWEEWYGYAKKYYEHYHNLMVPFQFKTNDGYTRDDNGSIVLGGWIANQRRLLDPNSERGALLKQIGMVWNVKKNREEVMEICRLNDIAYDINKHLLDSITVQELTSKIAYLKAHNLELTNNDGVLHEIFGMSSVDMKEKYGLSLSDMIKEYGGLTKGKICF